MGHNSGKIKLFKEFNQVIYSSSPVSSTVDHAGHETYQKDKLFIKKFVLSQIYQFVEQHRTN